MPVALLIQYSIQIHSIKKNSNHNEKKWGELEKIHLQCHPWKTIILIHTCILMKISFLPFSTKNAYQETQNTKAHFAHTLMKIGCKISKLPIAIAMAYLGKHYWIVRYLKASINIGELHQLGHWLIENKLKSHYEGWCTFKTNYKHFKCTNAWWISWHLLFHDKWLELHTHG